MFEKIRVVNVKERTFSNKTTEAMIYLDKINPHHVHLLDILETVPLDLLQSIIVSGNFVKITVVCLWETGYQNYLSSCEIQADRAYK